ncbi:uncharacterized protein LOC144018662 [Festucalex cinctus]
MSASNPLGSLWPIDSPFTHMIGRLQVCANKDSQVDVCTYEIEEDLQGSGATADVIVYRGCDASAGIHHERLFLGDPSRPGLLRSKRGIPEYGVCPHVPASSRQPCSLCQLTATSRHSCHPDLSANDMRDSTLQPGARSSSL